MREIKFRGKIIGSKGNDKNIDWAYGNLVEELSTGKKFIIDLSHFNKDTTFKEIAIEIIIKTESQYTGLKDKNGVEIYEGDFLQYEEILANGKIYPNSEKGIVEFSNGCFRLMGQSINQFNLTKMWKVIGNIYENPELLK